MTIRPALQATILVAGFAGLAGIVFAMWADKGPQMFLALVETGLAWCF
ncbi:hypothetical protein FQ775_23945 [Nitratireductor mangrovi]|uniref:Uncharacterized protein n=1 Tax=Nitratireductor mangrovi TaxID=2599600 RepID=A0A6H0DYH5_9HYPH|nr:hypothetical protein [Nitratireductor mangrovi]QIS94655.1 hypothetical protein FQ775_23945 [Nitratireductor mangrovi]